tara:strand:- start:1 stop:435 length:435 start_codon:yes stop_codon:yes gene_type:complete
MNVPIKEHNALKRIMTKQKERIMELENKLSDKSEQNNLGYYVANSINGGGRVEQKDKYNIDFTTKEITDVIITALCNYYDYNELHPSEGRMVVTAIRDIQRYVRDIKYDNILDDLMDIISNERTGQEEDLKDAIYDYFNKLKNK